MASFQCFSLPTFLLLLFSVLSITVACPFAGKLGIKATTQGWLNGTNLPHTIHARVPYLKKQREAKGRVKRKLRRMRRRNVKNCDKKCARQACRKTLRDNDQSEVPDLLRAVFHDHQPCALDGSLQFELDRPENLDMAGATEKVVSIAEDCECKVADIYALCAAQTVSFTGGPKIRMRWGHSDAKKANPDGNLPPFMFEEGRSGPAVLRKVLNRYNDKEIVLLSSAHELGHFHVIDPATGDLLQQKGFTTNQLLFDNEYLRNLKTIHETGETPPGTFQMESDLALIEDEGFRKWVLIYAENKDRYFRDFRAFMDLMINDFSKCKK